MTEIVQNPDGSLAERKLSLSEYATKHDVSTRAVKTWLSGRGTYVLRGAEKDELGHWQIPEHAVKERNTARVDDMQPQDHSAATLTLVPPAAERGQLVPAAGYPMIEPPEPTLREDLDDEPAFLTVEDAARYLGIPQAQIIANADRFGLEAVGFNGSLRVPQRVIRRVMGV